MLIIGMLHHRKDPRNVTKSYAYAAVAKAEGAELLYFSPRCVDFENRKIHGYIFENGSWQKTSAPFPHVIYNAGSSEKLEKTREIIANLKKEIPFTTYSIGHKLSVYERIKNAGEFSQYLVPSEKVNSIKELVDFIDFHRQAIIKPVVGHKGQGVVFIEKCGRYYHLQVGNEHLEYSLDDLRRYIMSRMQEDDLLMQPFINCKTKAGCSYDFRLHVQKNGCGQWVITAIYPRIGPQGSIITNINQGGHTVYLDPFLKQEFGDQYYNAKRYLEHFSLQLARHFDNVHQKLFSEALDELGVDVAFDDLGRIRIYEINWRPGCPPAFYLELDVVKNMIRYAMYLARKQQNQGDNLTD